ncbi:excinuclease ABC subunit UvrC [Clostridium sp. MD294]|uniref:excinuclease ABC subunit UvrC n=1 Tax=Clostridium sp. MD294 TaxID=97138 RepID=UPI0002CAA2E9|nr:excinuclease ABC subunit UvrC [Clostridium sp. MD294]NDO45868.1 excinuclease ABC subunit UvrC [Clostridium sp. MD294]USF30474.1 UvrABC system protein C [Clostridium sp. MD294]
MFDIEQELKKVPQKPGVYLMKDEKEQIIYVGKAINLKNRVRQYFQNNKNHAPKVQTMVQHIKEFEYIITDNELEALLLECNLIKKHKPFYNILLKDGKTYPYIKITNEAYPRVFITRSVEKDKAKYFGPITDGFAIKQTIDTIQKLWPIRKCKKNLPKDIAKERPCLNYHIGQCCAPCDNKITQQEYQKMIIEIEQFINGKHETIIKRIEKEMCEASEHMEFEKAAILRDKLISIKNISEKQKITNTVLGDCDVAAFVRANEQGLAQMFFIRGGKMTGREQYHLHSVENRTRSEVMTEFIKQFYSGTAFIPKEIILQEELVPEEKLLLEQFLTEKRGNKVIFTIPKKGEKRKLIDLAWKNAMISFEQSGERIKREQNRTVGAMQEIQNALGLQYKLERVEAYDISNTQGFESVGAMVVFENGKAKYSDYRKFKIKTVIGANDFASMKEMITRRMNHAVKEKEQAKKENFARLPDLILMDGGSLQVQAAEEVLKQFDIDIAVCGMVKDDKHRTRGMIFKGQEILIDTHTEGFKLLTRIQDEVHRFAIEYHRKLREKKTVHSVLDDIPNIGKARKKALMEHFGNIEAIANAEVEQILQIPQMTIQSAESVYRFFRI